MKQAVVGASEAGAASNGSSLGLLRLPFAFSQDQLLTSEAFIEARSYEIELTHDLL